MAARTRFEMGIMAGVVSTVVMSIAVIIVTAVSSAWNGFFPIQWYSWLGAVFGATGTSGQLAEMGVVWFIALAIIAGLIFAFGFKQHTVFQGLAFGGVAWLLLVLYLLLYTAPQLSGTLGTMSIASSVDLLLPLAVCFGLWGLTIGYLGKKYV
ncbi:MAG: hypothetical protein ABSG45_06770 [Nitrososphaerales archaeon]